MSSRTHTRRNIATGERKEFKQRLSFQRIKGCVSKPIITYKHSEKSKNVFPSITPDFFPSNWIRSRSENISLIFEPFRLSTLSFFLCVCVSVCVCVCRSLREGKQPESETHRVLVATAANQEEWAKSVCNGICVIACVCVKA